MLGHMMPRPTHAFVASLKACTMQKDAKRGVRIHEEIARLGLLGADLFVASALIHMYAKCGLLAKAREVLARIPIPNVVAWTALIAGYVEHKESEEALLCLEQMRIHGVSPNAVTYVCCLKACGEIGAMDEGLEMHAEVEKMGLLRQNHLVCGALVEMYVKCGALARARDVFRKLCFRNLFSWNTMISGHVEQGQPAQALAYLEEMHMEVIDPDSFTFVWSLKACGNLKEIGKGQEMHAELARKGLLAESIVKSALIDMYAKCGMFSIAEQVFDELGAVHRDIVSWTALIAGYAEHDYGGEALRCFEQMKLEGSCPDGIASLYGLKACGSTGAASKGRGIHAGIEHLRENLLLRSSLVDMYVKCELLVEAKRVLDDLPVRDAVVWTTLIAGYADHGHGEEALQCFERMQNDGISANAVTLVSCLRACASLGDRSKGEKIHSEAERTGLLRKDLALANTLIDMYAKCGAMGKAQEVFDQLDWKDVVSWNALMAGYADNGHGDETMKCLESMQDQGVPADNVTCICTLKACAMMGTISRGLDMHDEIARKGLLDGDMAVASALVDMYVKCGHLGMARSVFGNLPVRDIALWNSMISGYSQMGEFEDVLPVFDSMLGEGVKPDSVTFVVVFNVFSRLGLFSKGETLFEAMSRDYGILPCIEHQARMVNLLGVSGQLGNASSVVEKIVFFHPDPAIQNAILGSCRSTGNLELAEQIFSSG